VQHEINNPLAGLLATAELMKLDMTEKGESTEDVEVIIQQARRITELVKRMGTLQDPQSVQYFGNKRMIDLGEKS